MTPLSAAHTELALCITHIEKRHEALRAKGLREHLAWEDHRTEAIGDLWEAMDRIDAGLGTRLFLALYPHGHAQVDQLREQGVTQ